MGKVSPPNAAAPMMMLIALSTTMALILIPTGIMGQQLIPPAPPPFPQIPGLLTPISDIIKCWSSLTSIPSCLAEIYSSYSAGQIGKLGPACCAAINQISDSCWPKMFPLSPSFPPGLKTFCALPQPQAAAAAAIVSGSGPGPKPNVTEIIECWSSITNIEGCALEIYKSLTTGHASVRPVCCKAVTEIKDECWPKMFPFNPFFPPLLKNTCANIIEAPSPTATT